MRALSGVIVLVVALALPAPVLAADFDTGLYLKKWRPLAEQGDAEAQYNLGLMYDLGIDRPDYAEAVKWYRLAAEQGLAEAQASLGVMYYQGKGVPRDYAEVVKWYRLAAEQGYLLAQVVLGIMYHIGEGVPRDYVQAHMWYSLAAERRWHQLDVMVSNRDDIEANMTPDQVAEAERLAREWKPK